MSDKRVIDGRANDRTRRREFKSRKIFALAERDQSQLLLYLLHDAHALGPGDAWSKGEAGQRSVYFAQGTKSAEIVFSRVEE